MKHKIGNGEGTNGNGGNSVNGRPTKYKPEYAQQLLEWMAGGMSFESFAGQVGVTSIKTLYNWRDKHPDFLQAQIDGRMLGRAYWEGLGKRLAEGMGPRVLKTRTTKTIRKPVMSELGTHMVDRDGNKMHMEEVTVTETHGAPQGNTAAWIFNMINRYPEDWKQRVNNELTGKDGGPIKTQNEAADLSDDQLRSIQGVLTQPS